jgi:acetyltransferase-like isoleucine patch superfamily enzyme
MRNSEILGILGEDCKVGNFVEIGRDTVIGEGAVIRSHTVIYGGVVIGRFFSTGHGALIREKCRIGDNVSIGSHVEVAHSVLIGDRCRVHSGVFIPEYSILEDDCWIGPCAVLTNSKYPKSTNSKDNLNAVVVKKNAKVGANVTILPGIVIGENSLVGAGMVVAGNPAKVIKEIEEIKEYE